MTFTHLFVRNLLFHWRGNLAVLLGVAIGSAVLTGALLVGDSLRGSLRAQALEQLGWVDHSLVAGRFFREELAAKLPAKKITPALLVEGSAATKSANAGKVTILAVDERFWPPEQMPVDAAFWQSQQKGVVLNRVVAEQLGVKVGDAVTLGLQSADNLPRESLLGKRKSDDVLSKFDVTVRAILPDHGLGQFTLRPGPAPPANAFVPLKLIQDKYDPDKGKAPLKGRVNALLAGTATGDLNAALRQHLTLDDWGLELRTPADRARDWFKLLARGERADRQGKLRAFHWKDRVPADLAAIADDKGFLAVEDFVAYVTAHHGYLSLESSQLFVEPSAVSAVEKAARKLGWRAAPTLVYLVDTIGAGKQGVAYAVVAALDAQTPPPLGPMGAAKAGNGILVARWPGSPLKLEPGQQVTLSYYRPDDAGQLQLMHKTLPFAGWVELTGAADDADLTPRFEGITDKLDIREWINLPFPYDDKRVKDADKEYWKRHRTTPKAYVSLATGQELWGSRFGNVTTLRLVPPKVGDFGADAAVYRRELLDALSPEDGGLVFADNRAQALAAGNGSTDFGMYFLGFSSFLIMAALLLVGLLVRLSLDQRAGEMGLLLAVGWRRGAIRWLLLTEGTALALVGALCGVGGALVYAGLLLDLLSALWPGGLDRSFLRLHTDPVSCAIGYGSSVAVSVATIFLATRVLAKVPPPALLAGETIATAPGGSAQGWPISVGVACAALMAAVGCLVFGAFATNHEAQAGSFFGSGTFVLTALLALLWWWMRRSGHGHGRAMPGLVRLGVRNAARHPVRSVLTVGLLASACFIVVAVQAFHRDPSRDFLEKTGGSGGFAWVAETSVPLFQDLNSPAGRTELGLPAGLNAAFVPFRVRPGDDASCLNLYQPRQPRILGVPRSMIERGGFHFAAHEGKIDNPWQLLAEPRADGAIPAIGEANTVAYILHSGLGQEIEVRDGQGQKVRIRIVALLQDSVFQGELLIADGPGLPFQKMFPRQEGFQFFLIDAPGSEGEGEGEGDAAHETLTAALADYGFSMTASSLRLQSYLDVENTYLATFQALGGLGLLLGTLGLAVVLVRSVWERRGELALLRALGFRRGALGWLILAENAWLLLLGLAFGCAAAAVSVAPFLGGAARDILQPRLLALLLIVIVVGLAAGAAAVATTLRTPLLPALRRE